MVDQRDSHIDRRNDSEEAEQQQQPRRTHAGPKADEQWYRQECDRDGNTRADIASDPQGAIKASRPCARARLVSNLYLEIIPSGRDQIITRIRQTGLRIIWLDRMYSCSHSQRRTGHLQLRQPGTTGQLFHGAAIEIARREIHLLEAASRPENIVDQTDPLEQLLPIDVGDESHASYDISHGDASGNLPLVLVTDDSVGSRPLHCQLFVEPRRRWRNTWILIMEPMDEFHEKTV